MRKPLVGTWYAVRDKRDGTFWIEEVARWGSFQRCTLYPTRRRARDEENDWAWGPDIEIIDVRCRALSPRTKASRKRTR